MSVSFLTHLLNGTDMVGILPRSVASVQQGYGILKIVPVAVAIDLPDLCLYRRQSASRTRSSTASSNRRSSRGKPCCLDTALERLDAIAEEINRVEREHRPQLLKQELTCHDLGNAKHSDENMNQQVDIRSFFHSLREIRSRC